MIKLYLSGIYWVYVGLILGVSFLATPVKFKVASLTLPVALQIGRETFHLFNKVEWLFVIALISSSFWVREPWFYILNGLLLVLLCIDTFMLLPQLDARIDMLIQGQVLGKSMLHKIYVLIELLKLGLVGFGAIFIQSRFL